MTFLFTDIEGSTRLLKSLGRDRYGEVLSMHNKLLRKAFTDEALGPVREALLLSGFSELPVSAYDRITDLENEMESSGGLRLL